jgi:hypothetical protein
MLKVMAHPHGHAILETVINERYAGDWRMFALLLNCAKRKRPRFSTLPLGALAVFLLHLTARSASAIDRGDDAR